MARKPMVTRTIITTKVTAMCVDITNGETSTATFVLPRIYTDEKKLLKVAKETFETETTKVVHIVDKEEIETLYGMTEQEFIANSKVLDPETRKAIEEADAETEATN